MRGNATEEIEIKSTGKGGVVGLFCGSDFFSLPGFTDELINDFGGVEFWIGKNEFLGRLDFDGGNPLAKGFDFLRRELLAGRHVGIRADLDGLEEWALSRVAGDESGIRIAAFDGGIEGAEIEAAFLFHSAVALGAVLFNDGMSRLPRCGHAEAQSECVDQGACVHKCPIIRANEGNLSGEFRGGARRSRGGGASPNSPK